MIKNIQSLFSFKGRIRRLNYVITLLIHVFIIYVLSLITIGLLGAIGSGLIILPILLIIIISYFWILFAQGAKRCHDLGKSGWFKLIPFFVFWMIFKTGMSGGNKCGNKYDYDAKLESRNNMDDILDSNESL